jgi:hypothetical protein
VFIIALGLGGYAAYDEFYKPSEIVPTGGTTNVENKLPSAPDPVTTSSVVPVSDKLAETPAKSPHKKTFTPIANPTKKPVKKHRPVIHSGKYHLRQTETYAILKNAYFYSTPDTSKRTDVYLTPGDADLTLKEERGAFQYAVFIDQDGKPIKGWLLKKDFKPETDY